MDFYGVLFGIWFGVGCYRMFEMIEFDAMQREKGIDPLEEWDVSPGMYFFWSSISAFGWPILMPYVYWVDRDEEEDV